MICILKQQTMSGSDISWAICKPAPHSRQIAMPAPHHSVFLQGGCPSCRPTNSIKALKASSQNYETTDAAKNVATESQQQKQPTFTRKNVMP